MTEAEKLQYEQYKLAYAAFIVLYPFELEDLDGEIWAHEKFLVRQGKNSDAETSYRRIFARRFVQRRASQKFLRSQAGC